VVKQIYKYIFHLVLAHVYLMGYTAAKCPQSKNVTKVLELFYILHQSVLREIKYMISTC